MSALDDLLSELEAPVVSRTAKATQAKATASKPADDLDSLLADLSPITTKKTTSSGSAAPKKTAPVDDLDALLNDLGGSSARLTPSKPATSSPAATKKVAALKPAAPSTAASDDLDGLLNDLGGVSAPAPKKVAAPKTTAATNDLDSLLSDLSAPARAASPASAKKFPASTPASKPANDLDSLLGELGGAPAPKKVASPKPTATPAKPAAASKPADDLDSLLGELGGAPVAKPAAAKVTSAPAARPAAAKPVDDLDALMADLGGPSATPKKAAAATKPVDDLDSLMADLGSPAPAASVRKPSSPAVASSAATTTTTPKKNSGDDLDSLMADLGGGAKPATSSFKTPAAANNNKRADELDSLMDSLSSSSLNTKPKNSSNDLDDLMSSLATPTSASTAVRPAAPSMASRPPAGSVSRFEDLISTVSADMNDIGAGAGKSRGICYHCRQPIYDECMQALGRTYHPEHFMCGSCNNPLGTGSFFELAGQAHCQRCYQIQFCPKCAHCNQAISDRCVTALDKKWHVNCFVCTQCTSPFSGNFFERDGRPYCDKCFHQVFAPRCRSCNLPVLGDCVNALGAQWHPEHFNCQFCRRAFTGTFFEYEGMPYCEAHYYQKMGSSCAGCQQPISGACVDALGKKWHPEHFVCAFCMNKLEGTSYSEKNAKPYCRGCFGKLFGS